MALAKANVVKGSAVAPVAVVLAKAKMARVAVRAGAARVKVGGVRAAAEVAEEVLGVVRGTCRRSDTRTCRSAWQSCTTRCRIGTPSNHPHTVWQMHTTIIPCVGTWSTCGTRRGGTDQVARSCRCTHLVGVELAVRPSARTVMEEAAVCAPLGGHQRASLLAQMLCPSVRHRSTCRTRSSAALDSQTLRHLPTRDH